MFVERNESSVNRDEWSCMWGLPSSLGVSGLGLTQTEIGLISLVLPSWPGGAWATWHTGGAPCPHPGTSSSFTCR